MQIMVFKYKGMIRPDGARSFTNAVKMCFLVINNLRKILKNLKYSTSVGDEGGFAPMINNNEEALKLITKSIKMSGFVNGKDVSICLSCCKRIIKKINMRYIQKIYFSI